jgi:hypothetical protein
MSVAYGVRGAFVVPPIMVSSAPGEQSYPIVRRVLWSSTADAGSLAIGDRLERLQGDDLRGVSAAGYTLRWSAAAQIARSLLFTIERGGVRSDVRAPLVPGSRFPGCPWWAPLPFILSLVGTALLLLVRAAHWHLARRYYVAALLFASVSMPYFRSPTAPLLGITNGLLVAPLAYGLTLWNVFEFLPGTLLGPWQRAVVWALALLLSASAAASLWLPNAGGPAVLIRSGGLVESGLNIAVLAALAQAYRRSDALGRRQVKWVVFGFYVTMLPNILFGAVSSLGILPEWIGGLYVAVMFAGVAIPLGWLVAIAFYQYLDIDRLFSATLSYSVLAIIGIAIVLGVMPTASRAASAALGLEPASAQLLLALGLAAVVVPAYRILRPRIDRLFFPQRVAFEQGSWQLLTEIASCADAQELTRLVGDRLDALLRPASAVSYARAGDVFTPIAVRGRTAPPAFAAQSALIAALQERTTPLAADRWTPRHAASLSPFERAALETLDVAVLLPIRRGPDLVAFSCIGPKRSGDIYTPTDLAWLGAVAGKISDRLLSLDATAVAEQARTMHNALQPVEGSGSEDTAQGAAGRQSETSDHGPGTNLFRKEGDYWSIAFEGCTFRLRDVKGLHYLAHLLRHPGQEVHVLQLVQDCAEPREQRSGFRPPLSRVEGGQGSEGIQRSRTTPDQGPSLDAKAKAAYQRRVHDLRAELDEAERNSDLGGAAKARAEMELIAEQLAAAVGLGGRDRPVGADAERARLTVTKSIKAALEKIRANQPELARHLAASIKTGYFCGFTPDPKRAGTWVL